MIIIKCLNLYTYLRKTAMNNNQEKVCYTCFHRMKATFYMWRDPQFKQRALWREFYIQISTIRSPWKSVKSVEKDYANEKDRIVDEHWSTPELVGKFILDNADVYLEDYDKFRDLYITCSQTIQTLHSENLLLREQKDVPVLEKYKEAKIDLIGPHNEVRLYDELFPFTLPEELIEYDKKLILDSTSIS